MARFGEVITAMVTPFNSHGDLDVKAARSLASHLVSRGSDGVLLVGSTGESPVLSDSEKSDLVRSVVEEVGDRASVMVGCSTYDTAHSVELAKAAQRDGADVLLAVTPYYSRPTQDGIVAHFEAIAAATDLPLLVYNIPSRTGRLIELDTLVRLSENEKIVGVKDAAGDVGLTARTVAATPEGFEVYSGDDILTLPMLSVGAVGVISVASHLVGPEIKSFIGAFVSGDVSRARAENQRLLEIYRLLFVEPNPAPVKAALGVIGFPVGDPRLPLLPASAELTDQIGDALVSLGVEVRH